MDSYMRNHAKLMTGLRVVRGESWKFCDKGSSNGCVGTVIKWENDTTHGLLKMLTKGLPNAFFGLVSVIWDSGIQNQYRIGHGGAFDLLVVDNSATGVEHELISCVQCCSAGNIVGIRWHCESCDRSICSTCFFQEKHDQTHTKFKRYETPMTRPVNIVLDSKRMSERIELKGMFQGARVKRSTDWNKEDEDIADGAIGIGLLMGTSLAPGMVKVKWQNGKVCPYRLGADGKVDLKLVEAASGGFYHPEHLPVLKPAAMKYVTNSGGELEFAVGDSVQFITEDEEELKKLHKTYGCSWNNRLKNFIGKYTIWALNEVNVFLTQQEGVETSIINPQFLLRLSDSCSEPPLLFRKKELNFLAMKEKVQPHFARNQLVGSLYLGDENNSTEVILGSNKSTKRKLLHCDWVDVLTKNKQVSRQSNKLKAKMGCALVQAASPGQKNIANEHLSKFPIEIIAFHAACRNGYLELVKELYLMAKEKKLTILEEQDSKGRRAIHHAADGCYTNVLHFLIKPDDDPKTEGADLNARDKNNLTALQIAVRRRCLQTIKLLVEKGSDVNLQDSCGDTALHNAVFRERQPYQSSEIIAALISSNKIDFELLNNLQFNPLCLAIFLRNHKIFDQLLKAGGEQLANALGAPDNLTAYHFICSRGDLEFAKILFKHDTEIFLGKGMGFFRRCFWPKTSLSMAISHLHFALVEFLIGNYESEAIGANFGDCSTFQSAVVDLENLSSQPNSVTSPAIFKIHTELKEKHPNALIRHPGLSMMCYLIWNGCLWREVNNPTAKTIIDNKVIHSILESYER